MSRYTVLISNLEYAYGFDEPLQEYFFEKYDICLATEDNEEGCVYSISSHYSLMPHPAFPDKSSWSKGDILNLIKEEETKIGESIWKDDHVNALAMDLKF